MELHFAKWHGTGNDFIIVDDHGAMFPIHDREVIRHLCDRHFGVGSDGLILVQAPRESGTEYHMEFFNPDGSQSFCGNGSRCTFAFWRQLMGDDPNAFDGDHTQAWFTAIDGRHGADVRGSDGEVGVTLDPPKTIEKVSDQVDLIHTGSPHLLVWTSEPDQVELIEEARRYRYNDRFKKEGVNVNFLRWNEQAERVEMRTYERGVEAETLSCGTGVTAAALGAIHRGFSADTAVEVHTRGGRLRVEAYYDRVGEMPRSVTLIGAAKQVFHGVVTL